MCTKKASLNRGGRQTNKMGRKKSSKKGTKTEKRTRWSTIKPDGWEKLTRGRRSISRLWKHQLKYPSCYFIAAEWWWQSEWLGGINNSRWRQRGQTNAFPLGGWSLKPAPSASWEAGQNHTARLMRDNEGQGGRSLVLSCNNSLDKQRQGWPYVASHILFPLSPPSPTLLLRFF